MTKVAYYCWYPHILLVFVGNLSAVIERAGCRDAGINAKAEFSDFPRHSRILSLKEIWLLTVVRQYLLKRSGAFRKPCQWFALEIQLILGKKHQHLCFTKANPPDPFQTGVDLVILDNLSTRCTNESASASDAWVPIPVAETAASRHCCLAGTSRGHERSATGHVATWGCSGTVIALRRPEDYSPEQGARFEVHFEKLRNQVDDDAAVPFEAKLAPTKTDETSVR
jgi:hypothetical protein